MSILKRVRPIAPTPSALTSSPKLTRLSPARSVNAGTMPIIFFKAGGVVFYTDAIDLLEDTLVPNNLSNTVEIIKGK